MSIGLLATQCISIYISACLSTYLYTYATQSIYYSSLLHYTHTHTHTHTHTQDLAASRVRHKAEDEFNAISLAYRIVYGLV
jgi:hypothetical protein